MSDKKLKSVIIALGYFDCVHIGHKRVIEEAKKIAVNMGISTAVFTFKGNLRAKLYDSTYKGVYGIKERVEKFYKLGIDEVYLAPTSKSYLNKGKLSFLNGLNKVYDIKGYVCGDDYKFGKDGKGDIKYLQEYAKSHGQILSVVDSIDFDGKRISTTTVRELLLNGETDTANKLLGEPYSVSGKVIKGRGDAKRMGLPTANIKIDDGKLRLKDGVYGGFCSVDGKRYKAVINYGKTPTFNDTDDRIELHLLDFSGNLYNKTVVAEFCFRIRDIKKFDSIDELINTIEKDIKYLKEKL